MIKINELKKLSVDEIYSDIRNDIDDLYNKYSFINLDKDVYEKLVKKIIIKFKENDKHIKNIKDNVSPFLVSYITKKYKIYIGIQVNELNKKEIITNALEYYVEKSKKNDISSFRDFCEFLSGCKIELDEKLINSIFKNKKLHSILSSIVKNNKYLLSTMSYNYETEAENIIIDCFLDYENIVLEEEKVFEQAYDGCVSIYLQQAGHKILSREEEVALAIKCKNGTEEERKKARKKFAEHNLKLVIKIASSYQGRGVEFGDLIGFGNEGLLKAIDKFDVEKGFKFTTFGTWWIRQAIIRGIGDTGRNIRLPIHTIEKIHKVRAVSNELTRKHGFEPQPSEIAEILNWDVEYVEELINLYNDTVSINTFVSNDEDAELGDFISDDNALDPEAEAMRNLERLTLAKILEYAYKCKIKNNTREMSKKLQMDSREITVFVLRRGLIIPKEYNYILDKEEYIQGFEYTLDTLGSMYNITRERIRQIDSRALRKVNTLVDLYKKNKILNVNLDVIPRDKSLYEELPDYTKEEINDAVLALKPNDQIILGHRNDELFKWTSYFENKFRDEILPEIQDTIEKNRAINEFSFSIKLEKELLTNEIFNAIIYANINECSLVTKSCIEKLAKGKLFASLFDKQDEFNQQLLDLRMKKTRNRFRTIEEIASILKLDDNEVSINLELFLNDYKSSLNNVVKLLTK